MINPMIARELRGASPAELTESYGGICRDKFAYGNEAVPVVIAAHNEELDLSATLVSLAMSSVEVAPIVVDNGSDDETIKAARDLGACTLRLDRASKMEALQIGVNTARETRPTNNEILFVDADTLVGKNWAMHMKDRLAKNVSPRRPGIVCGGLLFSHGGSTSTDVYRSMRKQASLLKGALKGRQADANGANMAISFTPDLHEKYEQIDSSLFGGEDAAIRDIVVAGGGVALSSLHPFSTVITRGDRIGSLAQYKKTRESKDYQDSLYSPHREAHGLNRYDGSNALNQTPEEYL